ncbi:CDP-glycerol glycerophosphotransferase family protein [Patescibacteria group bacterium]|nr:CDP-glycerol glycerophosphotransferase family protein [Patescibacteria group bacterium]
MKTIFITITRGLIARNVLRNRLLEYLKNDKNLRVVIFVASVAGRKLPDYFFDEFQSDNVIIEVISDKKIGKIRKIFQKAVAGLVYSPTTRLHAKYGSAKVKRKKIFTRILHFLFYGPLGGLRCVKSLVRLVERMIFSDREYRNYFERYKPNLVFSTSLLSNFDLAFLKEARRRGVKTVCLPKSWDTMDKILFRFEPDLFLVQYPGMLDDAVMWQGLKPHKVKIVGYPQFDIYNDKKVLKARGEYCFKKGFDDKLPILFLGSEGLWSPNDAYIFRLIYDAREHGLIPNCNLLIRPHFSQVNEPRYKNLNEKKNICIDDGYRRSNFFVDRWDPNREDMIDFANSLHHCDLMITFASTLVLDAVCFDKPLIAVSFGTRIEEIRGHKKDLSFVMYLQGFYRRVIDTGAITVVKSREELYSRINDYLKNPTLNHEKRKILLDKMCYEIDGRTGVRIYQFLMNSIK